MNIPMATKLYESKLIDYQYRMCLYAKPPAIRPFSIVKIPSGCRYELLDEACLLLNQTDTPLNYNEVLIYIKGLSRFLRTCQEYLLIPANGRIEPSDVTLDERGEARFLYMPFEDEQALDETALIVHWLQIIFRVSDSQCEKIIDLLHPFMLAGNEGVWTYKKFIEVAEGSIDGAY